MKTSSKLDEAPSSIQKTQLEVHEDAKMLQSDLNLMIHFAIQRGIKLPDKLRLNSPVDDLTLMESYNAMIETISPATVQSIKYVQNQFLKKEKKGYLLNTPIFSKCLFIAVFALLGLILLSLSPDVNEENLELGLLASNGEILFHNIAFVCSASLLGVMFYLLKTISNRIKNYTLLPVDAIEVNATIIIGLISGFIISELFSINLASFSSNIELHKMTLALLGGFSSDAIFSVLQGIVDKTKLLFSSSIAT